MEHTERSDTELMQLAQQGSATAFAVLVHRHAPAVRQAVAAASDPTTAVVHTFTAAMRALPDRDPTSPVRPWLLQLAARKPRKGRQPVAIGSRTPPPLEAPELDHVWGELAPRWPDGRVARRFPHWLGRSALVVVLAALAVLVPYSVLSVVDEDDGPQVLPSVVARPLEEEATPPEPEEPPEEEPPPPFTFPDVDLDADPDPAPAPDPEPPTTDPTTDPEPGVEPAPVDESDPEPDPGPAPEPEPEPEPVSQADLPTDDEGDA